MRWGLAISATDLTETQMTKAKMNLSEQALVALIQEAVAQIEKGGRPILSITKKPPDHALRPSGK